MPESSARLASAGAPHVAPAAWPLVPVVGLGLVAAAFGHAAADRAARGDLVGASAFGASALATGAFAVALRAPRPDPRLALVGVVVPGVTLALDAVLTMAHAGRVFLPFLGWPIGFLVAASAARRWARGGDAAAARTVRAGFVVVALTFAVVVVAVSAPPGDPLVGAMHAVGLAGSALVAGRLGARASAEAASRAG